MCLLMPLHENIILMGAHTCVCGPFVSILIRVYTMPCGDVDVGDGVLCVLADATAGFANTNQFTAVRVVMSLWRSLCPYSDIVRSSSHGNTSF